MDDLEREASFNRRFYYYNQESYFLFESKSKSFTRNGGGGGGGGVVIHAWISTEIHNNSNNTKILTCFL